MLKNVNIFLKTYSSKSSKSSLYITFLNLHDFHFLNMFSDRAYIKSFLFNASLILHITAKKENLLFKNDMFVKIKNFINKF